VLGEDPGSITLIGGTIVLGALAASNFIALRRGKAGFKNHHLEPP
jgi:hypothetical protein